MSFWPFGKQAKVSAAQKKANGILAGAARESMKLAETQGMDALDGFSVYNSAEQMYKAGRYAEARPYYEELIKRNYNDRDFRKYWAPDAATLFSRGEGGTPVDMILAEEAARYTFNYLDTPEFEQYILGFRRVTRRVDDPTRTGLGFRNVLVPPTELFAPKPEKLKIRLGELLQENQEMNLRNAPRYKETKKAWLAPKYQSIYKLEAYFHLTQMGYWNVARTPEAVTEFFLTHAKQGNPDAQYWLSVCYAEGFVPEEQQVKDEWLLKAAKQGQLLAIQKLGSNRISDEDAQQVKAKLEAAKVKAAEYMAAMKGGDLVSMDQYFGKLQAEQDAANELADRTKKRNALYQSAIMDYAMGQQDKALAVMAEAAELGHEGAYLWLVGRAAEQGDAQAQYQMGEFCLTGTDSTPKNTTAAFEWLAKAASGGVANAFWRLGELYHNGADGFAANKEIAVSMYQKASEGGSLPGMLAYGDFCEAQEAKALYRKVVNTERTDLAARAYIMEGWRKLAVVDQSDLNASLEAAAWFTLMYFDPNKEIGYSGKKPAEAVKAALNGDAEAAYKLGLELVLSKDLADHEKIARVWYLLSVSCYTALVGKGDPDACRHLFYLYHDDLHDDGLARQWGLRALRAGDIKMYYAAAMNPKVFDLSEAQIVEYLSIAAANGDDGARNELEFMQRQAQWEADRQRWVAQVRREQAEYRQAMEERKQEEAIAAKLDSMERLANTLAYNEMFTDEERALMGKVSQMDAIRNANLRDDLIRKLKNKD